MPESRLKIVIDALNLAKGQAAEIEKELAGLEGQAKKTGGAMEALKKGKEIFTGLTGAVAGFAGTWKGALELGKAGAQLDLMDRRFDRLSQRIYTTGDALEGKLKVATNGLVSDSKLVATATDLMSLGLAKSEDHVVRLTRVSGALNMDMNQLVLTLANQTTMRFDQLGVAVVGFEERLKKLKATGMDANEAFTEAFLQQAEEQVAKVGGMADTSAGAFARFEAATGNLGDAFKRKLTPELAKAFEAASLLLTWNEKLEAAQKTHADQVSLTAKGYDEYVAEIERARGVQGAYIDDKGDLVNTLIGEFESTQQVIVTHAALTRAEFDQVRATDELARKWQEYGFIATDIRYTEQTKAVEIAKNTQALKEQEAALTDLKTAIQGAVDNEYRSFIERQTSLKERAAEVKAEMDKLRGSQGAVAKDETKNVMTATDLALAQAKLRSSTEELSKATRKAGESDAEWQLRLAGLRNDIADQQEKLGSANQRTIEYVDNSKRIGELKTEYDKANEAIAKNAQEHEDATKRIILGFLEQRLAVDGWSAKEIEAYQNVARQMGLIDDSTWSMIGGINDALGALETGSMDEFLAKIAAIKNQTLGLPSGSPLGPPTGGGGGKVESYQSGGVVRGPLGRPQLAIVHGGEQITPVSSTVNNYYQNQRGGDTYNVYDARMWAMIQAQRRLAAVEARYG